MSTEDRYAACKKALQEAQTFISKQDEFLKKLTANGMLHVFISAHDPKRRTVSITVHDQVIEVDQPKDPFKVGDECLVTRDTNQIVQVIGPPKGNSRFLIEDRVNVGWKDIGGLVEVKQAMIDSVELPMKYTSLYKKVGLKPPKGILLWGPPGCGKTMLGKAVAGAIGGNGGHFFYIKGAEMLSAYVGVAEHTIRDLFKRSRELKRETGRPVVIFVDEADGILRKRGSGISSDVQDTIIPTFLSELDGLDDNSALLLLSTNRKDSLDTAVTRDGRIDIKMKVPRPNEAEFAQILGLYTPGLDTKVISSMIFNNDLDYLHITTHDGECRFGMKHIVSGAMAKNIADRAKTIAVKRAITERSIAPEVSMPDLEAAVHSVFSQNIETCHDFLPEFITEHGIKPVAVNRLVTK